jgi:hypothetical protein
VTRAITFESRLQLLGVSKTRSTPLHLQSDAMVKRYIKTAEEHLRKVVASHQRDWDERLPLFLLAYRTSIHDTTCSRPGILMFGLELRLHCHLLSGAPSEKERPKTDNAADLMDNLHGIHHYAGQQLKLASDRMKTRYDKLANSAGYHRVKRVCSIATPARTVNRPSFNPRGKAHTR